MKIRFLNQRFTLSEIWKLRLLIRKILFSPKKIVNALLVCISKVLKAPKVLGAPLVLMVEISSRCDMACPMCPVILNKTKRSTGVMPFDTFRKIVDEVGARVLALALWNYGEPLLNPDMCAMIAYARKNSLVTVVSTNCLALDEDKIRQLLDSGLDYLIVSFDGATEETYELFRGKGNFNKVLANLRLLMKIKKECAQLLPFVELQYIVMKDNADEINDIKILARSLGVDKLSLKKFTYVGGNEALPFLVSQEEYLFKKIAFGDNLSRQAIQIEGGIPPRYLNKGAGKVRFSVVRKVLYTFLHHEKYKGFKPSNGCTRTLDSSVILWNADVAPCCGDLDFKYSFGNINTGESFMDIWNNHKYVSFREEALRDITSIPMCRRCPSRDYNIDMFIE